MTTLPLPHTPRPGSDPGSAQQLLEPCLTAELDRRADGRVELRLRGELDLQAPPVLAAALAGLPPGGPVPGSPDTVEIDLHDAVFLDSAGLRALTDARATLVGQGWRVVLTYPRGNVRSLLAFSVGRGWVSSDLVSARVRPWPTRGSVPVDAA